MSGDSSLGEAGKGHGSRVPIDEHRLTWAVLACVRHVRKWVTFRLSQVAVCYDPSPEALPEEEEEIADYLSNLGFERYRDADAMRCGEPVLTGLCERHGLPIARSSLLDGEGLTV